MTYAVGDVVLVPCSRLGLQSAESALHRTEVVEVQGPHLRVQVPGGPLPGGQPSGWLRSDTVHPDFAILVLTISDIASEDNLLRPLAKSITQYLRLLLPDDRVRSFQVRSPDELRTVWAMQHAVRTHVVLIGHCDGRSIVFGVGGSLTATQLGDLLAGAQPKHFVSLACKSGLRDFAATFSTLDVCASLIAPFQSVHGAIASQFLQCFFSFHLLDANSKRP